VYILNPPHWSPHFEQTTPQSFYYKHYSTETALLYIHNHQINAVGLQRYHAFAFLISVLPLTSSTTIS